MISIKVEGLDELERQLKALGQRSIKLLRKAGREAMEPVAEDMKKHAGYDTTSTDEHLRDSIKIYTTTRGKALVTVRVGPSNPHYIKAFAQEFGTVKQVANPFIRPALEYNQTTVLKTLADEIRDGIHQR